MAKGSFGGYEFDLPEREYSVPELQRLAGASPSDIPVVRNPGSDRDDIILAPGEKVRIGNDDVVVYTTPMEAA